MGLEDRGKERKREKRNGGRTEHSEEQRERSDNKEKKVASVVLLPYRACIIPYCNVLCCREFRINKFRVIRNGRYITRYGTTAIRPSSTSVIIYYTLNPYRLGRKRQPAFQLRSIL